MYIGNNAALTSLNGLENITSGKDLLIEDNEALINICALYNVNFIGGYVEIYNNLVLSMDIAYALETQLRNNGFSGTAVIHDNNGSGLVNCDLDNDTVTDAADNCPDTCNSNQTDADGDGIGDVCDETPGCGGCGQPVCEESCELLIDKVEELLTHYYLCILGRTPDSGGLNYWTDEIMSIISSGGDIKEGFISFAQTFFNSQEYFDRDRDMKNLSQTSTVRFLTVHLTKED